MSVPFPWTARTFRFDFPVEFQHTIRSRLRGAPTRLEELMSAMPAPRLVEKVQGKWSIQENAGHLADLEPLWATRVDECLSLKRKLTPADIDNPATDAMNHNQRALGRILDGFRGGRLSLMHRLDELSDEEFGKTAHHARLDEKLRLVDLLYFMAEHDDHHLARMWALRELRVR